MGLIRRRLPRTSQPRSRVGVSRNNPICKGLISAIYVVDGLFYDAVTRQVAKPPPGILRGRYTIDGNNAFAVSVVGDGTSVAAKFANPTGLDSLSGNNFTIFVEASLEINSTTQDIFKSWESNNGRGIGIVADDNAQVLNGFYGRIDNIGSSNYASTFTALGTDSELYTHRFAFASDGVNKLAYAKGALNNTVANTASITADANRRTYMLSGYDPTAASSKASASLVLAWDRAISLSEYQSIYANPWQVLESEIRVVLSSTGGVVALTGTVTTATEADIVTGGKTIILTLTGDTWVAAGATFDAQRQNIINGIDSAQAEATGWDAVVKALQGVAGVVRTSATVVTITLDAQATYNITATETITATIPATALTGAVALVATPTFTVTAVTAGGWLNRGYWWSQTYGNLAR